jgi:hypothetical protein
LPAGGPDDSDLPISHKLSKPGSLELLRDSIIRIAEKFMEVFGIL